MRPLTLEGTKVYSNGQGHMTTLAAMSMYSKTLKIAKTQRQITLKLVNMQHSNDDQGLTMTYFKNDKVKFVLYALVYGIGKTLDF